MKANARLLALVLAGVALAVSFAAQRDGQTASTATAAPTPAGGTVVYYFHATSRCATCRTIEAYAHDAVTTAFAADLSSGSLEWQAVNVDEPVNRHFIQDFQL
jgi:uncharacterized membrane protein